MHSIRELTASKKLCVHFDAACRAMHEKKFFIWLNKSIEHNAMVNNLKLRNYSILKVIYSFVMLLLCLV